MNSYYEEKLLRFKKEGRFRTLTDPQKMQIRPNTQGKPCVNLSSNDYLGLAADQNLRREFSELIKDEDLSFSASSSRLQTGNTTEYSLLETDIAKAYQRDSALVFTSGYHLNSGVIAALTDKHTLILADKLVHASMIDGIRLSESRCIRYPHQDYERLGKLVKEHNTSYRNILIVTESIFSMDGDEADLAQLIRIKETYPGVMLYIDEAHAVGVRGKNGLGCCEEYDCIAKIDFIAGTFGKALGSVGAFLVCDHAISEYLINTVRPFIFTTALPPLNLAWTRFLFNKLPELGAKRNHLRHISSLLRKCIDRLGKTGLSTSHIIPFIIGDNHETNDIAQTLQKEGFYVLPIRPPTVPEGTARLRFSLHADMTEEQLARLMEILKRISPPHF
ncbi:MAG: 8-amino-7-oxononanoate synthase [Bacteroidales bacterium]